MRDVFVTWQDSRRSESLARQGNMERVLLVAARRGVLRHVLGIMETALLLVRRRPARVWYQFSVGLAVVLAAYRRLAPRTCSFLVADIHSKALRRSGGRLKPVIFAVKRWALRACTGTMVSNGTDAAFALRHFTAMPVIVPDPLPLPVSSHVPTAAHGMKAKVVCVCSFAADEPLELILQCAAELRDSHMFMMTGDCALLTVPRRERLQRAIVLTGFLPEPDYWQLLAQANAIVVLSTQQGSLPCGAYEALSLHRRPVVLDTSEARGVFRDLAFYARPDPSSLAQAVRAAASDGRISEEELAAHRATWHRQWLAARRTLEGCSCSGNSIRKHPFG